MDPRHRDLRYPEGDHFGYPGPLPPNKLEQPLIALHDPLKTVGVEAPFTYIPRRTDNSSGGEVWVIGDRWGLPPGTMLHFSYGQCTMMQVLQERVSGPNGESVLQGGTIPFPLLFDSGACRGKFSPHDGQLYVTGLRGWTTAATQDGCLHRVRFTGKQPYLPTAVKTYKNGLAITFRAHYWRMSKTRATTPSRPGTTSTRRSTARPITSCRTRTNRPRRVDRQVGDPARQADGVPGDRRDPAVLPAAGAVHTLNLANQEEPSAVRLPTRCIAFQRKGSPTPRSSGGPLQASCHPVFWSDFDRAWSSVSFMARSRTQPSRAWRPARSRRACLTLPGSNRGPR